MEVLHALDWKVLLFVGVVHSALLTGCTGYGIFLAKMGIAGNAKPGGGEFVLDKLYFDSIIHVLALLFSLAAVYSATRRCQVG